MGTAVCKAWTSEREKTKMLLGCGFAKKKMSLHLRIFIPIVEFEYCGDLMTFL